MNLSRRAEGASRRRRVTTILASAVLCIASVFPSHGQTTPTTPTRPTRTLIPVSLNATTGDITIGATLYKGAVGGFHIVAISRQPNRNNLESATLIFDTIFKDSASVNTALTNLKTSNPGAMILVNAVGNYGFGLGEVAEQLISYGSDEENNGLPTLDFVFVGIGGARQGSALLQRGYSSLPVSAYLAEDNNASYTLFKTDFLRYDLALNGDITIGTKNYPFVGAPGSCQTPGGFQLLVVNREDPTNIRWRQNYCTAQAQSEINALVGDLNFVTNNGNNEGLLVFLASNGSPIPSNWSFGTNGDARFVGLRQTIHNLGGLGETIMYMTPTDTYSLVGTGAPPSVALERPLRAREASSVYPEVSAGKRPSGELHGILARGGRGNWYSPLNADMSGVANLGLYEILALPPADFPGVSSAAQIAAYQYINKNICGSEDCNVRDSYDDLNLDFNTYQLNLKSLADSTGKNCDVSGSGADATYCGVRAQLLTEFTHVNNVRALYNNLVTLWATSGPTTILSLLSAASDVQNEINTNPAAPAQSLVSPLVNFFLGLGSFIPEVGPIFGLADVAFNLGTSLTTDATGSKTFDLTTTVGNLEQQAAEHFKAQANTTGTLFELVFQDWAKLNALGTALATQTSRTSPWYWSTTTTGMVLNQMSVGIRQAAYQSIMPAVFSVANYLPNSPSGLSGAANWGNTPLYQQPSSYIVGDSRSCPCVPISKPFSSFVPFTYPSDAGNPSVNDSRTQTLMGLGAWLAVARQDSPASGGSDDYQYTAPTADLMGKLFAPVWNGGLGLYRPVFFERWAFPRLACTAAFNGEAYGGCHWDSGAKPPSQIAASVRRPFPSVSIRAQKFGSERPRKAETKIELVVHNNGTADLKSIQIDSLLLRAVGLQAAITLTGQSLPLQVKDLKPGQSASFVLNIYAPEIVTQLNVVAQGSMMPASGRVATYSFSQSHTISLQ